MAELPYKLLARAEPGRSEDCCFDCARKYGDEFGFPDLMLPDEIWRRISPTKGEGGLLCPSCICRRLTRLNIRTTAKFQSGPIDLEVVEKTQDSLSSRFWSWFLKDSGHGKAEDD